MEPRRNITYPLSLLTASVEIRALVMAEVEAQAEVAWTEARAALGSAAQRTVQSADITHPPVLMSYCSQDSTVRDLLSTGCVHSACAAWWPRKRARPRRGPWLLHRPGPTGPRGDGHLDIGSPPGGLTGATHRTLRNGPCGTRSVVLYTAGLDIKSHVSPAPLCDPRFMNTKSRSCKKKPASRRACKRGGPFFTQWAVQDSNLRPHA